MIDIIRILPDAEHEIVADLARFEACRQRDCSEPLAGGVEDLVRKWQVRFGSGVGLDPEGSAWADDESGVTSSLGGRPAERSVARRLAGLFLRRDGVLGPAAPRTVRFAG